MQAYAKKIRRRVAVLIVLAIAAAGLIAVNMFIPAGAGGDHARGFRAGALTAMIGLAAALSIRYAMALKNSEKLKKLYIEETDERAQMMFQKSGSTGMTFLIGFMLASGCVAGFFNMTVFYTLIALALFTSFVRAAFKLYYMRKY